MQYIVLQLDQHRQLLRFKCCEDPFLCEKSDKQQIKPYLFKRIGILLFSCYKFNQNRNFKSTTFSKCKYKDRVKRLKSYKKASIQIQTKKGLRIFSQVTFCEIA